MTDIQRARDVLAKWRGAASPGPWMPQVFPSDGDAELCDARGSLLLGAMAAEYPSTMAGPDAVLTAGMTDPTLLDALDVVLEWGTRHQSGHATRLAAAIIAAEERMSA